MGRGRNRLADIGFKSYAAYLRSPHWRATRKAAGDAADWKCCACGKRATQIHHRTYRYIGQERPGDLRAVCEDCHKLIHHFEDQGMSLPEATDLVIAEGGAPKPVPDHTSTHGGFRVVKLPPGPRRMPQPRRKRPKPKKKSRTGQRRPEKPASKPVRGLGATNDKLHAIQIRNRERQQEARRLREWKDGGPV